VALLVVAVNRGLRQRAGTSERTEPDLTNWLDLVALGTVCDVVPLAD
jgi:single-stranded-DNA-specific exonuclease